MRPLVMEWMKDAVQRYRPEPPVLEVGAHNENGTARPLFPQPDYLGIDLVRGAGVDMVLDILLATPYVAGRFKTVYACETLEHVLEPWRAIEVMFEALQPGGLFLATWCFSFPIHAAPKDFYRVTPYGFHYLLSRAGFQDIQVDTAGTNRPPNRPADELDWQWPDMVAAAARRPLG
jgi:hypothetical protein